MLSIGIDPGTATTGYGLVHQSETGELEAVDYGVILTSKQDPMPVRLLDLYRQLSKIIENHQPEAGAVEKLFFQRNVKTAISVGQARGVAILVLAQNGLEVDEFTPLEIKQSVVGYGGADKNQVQQMVKVILRLDETPKPDDAADALAVAICHIHHARIQGILGDH